MEIKLLNILFFPGKFNMDRFLKKAIITAKKQELFPSAQVPKATSLDQVFSEWKKRGLEPVEVTRAETVQWTD